MVAEQTKTRKRQSHRPPAGIYHAPADMTGLQDMIAGVTIQHLLEGKRADFRNLAITYPQAFDQVWIALDETERAKHGITCPVEAIKAQMLARRVEREKAVGV